MFSDGLSAAVEKVEEYYDKTATSHAYTFVMRACSSLLFNIYWLLIFLIVLDPEDAGDPEEVDDNPAGWDKLFISVESDSED